MTNPPEPDRDEPDADTQAWIEAVIAEGEPHDPIYEADLALAWSEYLHGTGA